MSQTNLLSHDLIDAIEQLYQIFRVYPLRPHVDGCPHCVTDRDHQLIHSKPLRDLSDSDLSRFTTDALTTWGNENDYRHFLPRIFELAAIEPHWWINTEIIFSKLNYAGWYGWPKRERNAIHSYFMALFNHELTKPLMPEQDITTLDNIDCIICAIGQALDDLQPVLNMMSASDSAAPLCRTARFIHDNLPALTRTGKLGNPFRHERQEQMQQVTHWILDPDNETLIKRAVSTLIAKGESWYYTSVQEYVDAIHYLQAKLR